MPDGMPQRPSASPDLAHLLRLMSIRSEVVEQGADDAVVSPPPVEESPSAAASVLDKWVEAHVRQEEQALASDSAVEQGIVPVEDGDDMSPVFEPPEAPATALEPAAEAESEEPPVETEADMALDELLERESPAVEAQADVEPDQAAGVEEIPSQVAEGDQLPSFTAEAELAEGRGEDFQALLAAQPEDSAEPEEDVRPEEAAEPEEAVREDELPLLPADGDVTLRAVDSGQAGAEFAGKSTLADAGGIYCLIEGFDLPVGAHVALTISAAHTAEQLDIGDAVVRRVRKALGDSTEVQLAFAERHPEVEEFVSRHFGEKPGRFSLLGRLRSKH